MRSEMPPLLITLLCLRTRPFFQTELASPPSYLQPTALCVASLCRHRDNDDRSLARHCDNDDRNLPRHRDNDDRNFAREIVERRSFESHPVLLSTAVL